MNGIWFAPLNQLSKRDAVAVVVSVATAARQKRSFATLLPPVEGCP